MTFVFDAPTGTYHNPELSKALLDVARRRGPVLAGYCSVEFKGRFEELESISTDTARVLIYQARWLLSKMPWVLPHLRATLPLDFGRTKAIAWYDPQYEGKLIAELLVIDGPIRPEEVL